jgi:hypothetical protein
MRDLTKIQSITRLFPDMTFIIPELRASFITSAKQRAVCDLLENYPTDYFEISFELQKPDGRELWEAVEYFRCSDGRYLYDGNIVSRNWLAEELAQLDYKLHMTAWVKEKDADEKDT